MRSRPETDTIPLHRAGCEVGGLLGAFGSDLKETRLTGALGYFCSLEPAVSAQFFQFRGKPLSVSVEHRTDDGRSDIRFETDLGVGVVEAKVTSQDASLQAQKYAARWCVSLCAIPLSRTVQRQHKVRSVSWLDTGRWLDSCRPKCRPVSRIVAHEILRYLEEHNMITRKMPVEVYARDLGDPHNVRLFLEFGLYLCPFKANSRLAESLYFAPYLSRKGAAAYPGLREGLSHLARIEQVHEVRSVQEVLSCIRASRKRLSPKRVAQIKQLLRQRTWPSQSTFLLILGEPRMPFHPPIQKSLLQAGSGHLSKQFFSFEQLFKARDGEPAYE